MKMSYGDAVGLVIFAVFALAILYMIVAAVIAYPIAMSLLAGAIAALLGVAWVIYKVANR